MFKDVDPWAGAKRVLVIALLLSSGLVAPIVVLLWPTVWNLIKTVFTLLSN